MALPPANIRGPSRFNIKANRYQHIKYTTNTPHLTVVNFGYTSAIKNQLLSQDLLKLNNITSQTPDLLTPSLRAFLITNSTQPTSHELKAIAC